MKYWPITVMLWIGVGFAIWSWSRQTIEVPVVEITAAHDIPELGLPVYAQFVVTQTLWLPEVKEVAKLQLPVYWTTAMKDEMIIDILQMGRLLQRWKIRAEQNRLSSQVEVVTLAMNPPRQLAGEIEIQFSAKAISAANHETAPRIFTETADQNYPDGNYRIAQNSKEGDIELTLWAIEKRGVMITSQWRQKPLVAVEAVGSLGFILMLIGVFPEIIWKAAQEKSGA